jgi:hypothetical protein
MPKGNLQESSKAYFHYINFIFHTNLIDLICNHGDFNSAYPSSHQYYQWYTRGKKIIVYIGLVLYFLGG